LFSGLCRAFYNAQEIHANAFALFLKSRTWSYRPLETQVVEDFEKAQLESGIERKHILPHGQYIVNLGNPDETKRKQAYAYFLDDLGRKINMDDYYVDAFIQAANN
jgi:endonuclease IV